MFATSQNQKAICASVGPARSASQLRQTAPRGCLIGRAYAYGLGAGGQAGVARAIAILRKELEVSMALTGVARVADIGPQIVMVA